jgi:uncharacterized protein (DUF1501 family)
MNTPLSRRKFLGQIKNCAAIGSLPLLSSLLNLKLAGTLAAAGSQTQDYRALVCLFFSGGADSFNILVPRGAAQYAEYQKARGPIALAHDALLPIEPMAPQPQDFGLHPGLPGLQSLFNSGRAAFVANVGTLVEPVSRSEYEDGLKRLPLGLYSHSDQIEQWHTALPDVHSPQGWAGRTADLLRSLNTNNTVSMNISLSGSNVWQHGDASFEYSVSPEGAAPLEGYDRQNTDPYSVTPLRTRAIDSQLAFRYQHLLSEAFNSKKRAAIDAFSFFNESLASVPTLQTPFPETDLGIQLQLVAKAIAAHSTLGHSRQTFFIEVPGWDHHDGLLEAQASMLPVVDQAVSAFFNSLSALNLQNNVTLFSASDFARTLSTDSDGSDHAWGGNHFLVGGALKGRRIFGEFPALARDNPLDVGRGRFIPQIAVDSYFAELALWLGVQPSDLPLVLPNIRTFYSPEAGSAPLGFLL